MANSGVVVVTELRKFVNGVDTGQTKPNVAGDKNYIAPYLGTLTCLPNTDAVTTTTSTSTTSTTTLLSYKTFETSTISYSSTSATCNHPFTGNANSTRYFTGASNLPAINNTVYSDINGQNLLGTGRYYSALNSSEYTISSGKVTSIFACSAPPPVPVPVTPSFNYYYMRTCGSSSSDRVVRTTSTYTSASNSESTVSIYGTCYYMYNTATEYQYNNGPSDQSSIDTTGYTVYSGCTSCQGPAPTPVAPSPVAPTPVAAVCYDYEIGAGTSVGVLFSYTRCDGNVMSSYVPTGDSISICAQVNTVTMSPNSGSIVANALCSS